MNRTNIFENASHGYFENGLHGYSTKCIAWLFLEMNHMNALKEDGAVSSKYRAQGFEQMDRTDIFENRSHGYL